MGIQGLQKALLLTIFLFGMVAGWVFIGVWSWLGNFGASLSATKFANPTQVYNMSNYGQSP
jgi:hypothetical protein